MKYFGVLLFILLGTSLTAQDFSDLDKSPMDVAHIRNNDNSPMARIIYSRPQKREREIFGELVPYNTVWRTGANEATELTLYNDMMIEDYYICAGTYTLYTIPNKNKWTLIINEATNTWGTNYNPDLDIARIPTIPKQAAAPIETFSIALQPINQGALLLIGWDNVYIEILMKNISSE
ncbi:MAG: DUF2911 domain-containing protein [Mesonia hippocampi]|uniref:DUF2911 domain-containing protein n=1 Tax=Mesonia hippocampi TaxID=1628250 RepID=UPI003F9C6233